MKNNKLFIYIISLTLALCAVISTGTVAAFAVGEDDVAGEEAVAQEQEYEYDPDYSQDIYQDDTQYEQQEEVVQTEYAVEEQIGTEAPEREPMYEYIYEYSEDMTSAYEQPQYLDDLPEVTPSEVVEATAVVIPDVAVSDATMFSGIVMWLCVALGIAVIVGVMVSKRTRRRGV